MNNEITKNPSNSSSPNQNEPSAPQVIKNSNGENESTPQTTLKNNEAVSGFSTSPISQSSSVRDKFISLELNNLKSYGYYYGIYCVPRHFKPFIWDGVIIIRAGLYKNAKLKFYLELPRGFPKSKPELYFVSKVYHPLVNYETGHLDMKLLSPDWKGNSTISYNLFAWLKSIFLDHNYLQVTDSFNPKAGSDFLENVEAFYEKVCETIEKSEKELFEGEPTDGLKFNPYNTIHEVIQKKLGDVVSNKEIPDSLRVNHFIDSLLKSTKNGS